MASLSTSVFKPECSVCCEAMHRSVTCSCGFAACKTCCLRYMLDKTTLSCMSCKKAWDDRRWLANNFGVTSLKNGKDGVLAVMKKVQVETERARIPALMHQVARVQRDDALKEFRKTLKEDVRKDFADLSATLPDGKYSEEELRRITDRIFPILVDSRVAKFYRDHPLPNDGSGAGGSSAANSVLWIPCPKDGCRGVYDAATGKCAACNTCVCVKCREVKEDGHTCDPDVVKNVKQLQKECKPCPSCHVPIFKISGCDQMWCVQCNQAFSWATGRVERGAVHNPHYFEWMQRNGINRHEQQQRWMELQCGDQLYRISDTLQRRLDLDESARATVIDLHRSVTERRQYGMFRFREEDTFPQASLDLQGVRFIMGKIDEKQWASNIMMIKKRENRLEEERGVYTTMLDLITDQIMRFLADSIAYCDLCANVAELKTMANREFREISLLYGAGMCNVFEGSLKSLVCSRMDKAVAEHPPKKKRKTQAAVSSEDAERLLGIVV
jgi:hypothetical protein